jgi:hypothetical protein
VEEVEGEEVGGEEVVGEVMQNQRYYTNIRIYHLILKFVVQLLELQYQNLQEIKYLKDYFLAILQYFRDLLYPENFLSFGFLVDISRQFDC